MGVEWPAVCPLCGEADRVPVVWGRPGRGDLADATNGEVVLDGCVLPADFARVGYWACRGCGHRFPVRPLGNDSPIGRLLAEISWEGNARSYRHGGRGRENVLTTEVFALLDLLPRQSFLGAVLAAAHGADQARAWAAADAEQLEVRVLPGDVGGTHPDGSPTSWTVQPDVGLESWQATVWVEAKRIRPSSFQPHQLARTLHALLTTTGNRLPLLLLVLGSPPPLRVARHGTLDLPEAITHSMAQFPDPRDQETLTRAAREAVAWITWDQLGATVRRAAQTLHIEDPSLAGSVRRMADGIDRTIAWHT